MIADIELADVDSMNALQDAKSSNAINAKEYFITIALFRFIKCNVFENKQK